MEARKRPKEHYPYRKNGIYLLSSVQIFLLWSCGIQFDILDRTPANTQAFLRGMISKCFTLTFRPVLVNQTSIFRN